MSINSEIQPRVSIVANGFQYDYIINLNAGLSAYCKVDLIGSDQYLKYQFGDNINFFNLRGNHNEDVAAGTKMLRMLKYYVRLLLYILGTKSKVIHVQWLRFYITDGVLFPLLARVFGKKAFYTVHDVLPHDKDTKLNRLIFKVIYKSQTKIIVHTAFIRNRLLNEFNIKENKIELVKHGVYKVNLSEDISYSSARKQFDIGENDFVFLFFGWIAKYKGLDILLASFNKIKKEHANIKLVIAGRVFPDYTEDFEKLMNNTEMSSIKTTIRHIENDEVEPLFKMANVTVLPYTEASQSGVLFMSYAYGVPVIAPDLGGFPYDIEQGKTGMLFHADKQDDLYNTLRDAMIKYPGYNVERVKNIQRYAADNYSWDASCKKLFTLYANK